MAICHNLSIPRICANRKPVHLSSRNEMDTHVQHDPAHQRFETHIEGRTAYLSYAFQGDRVIFDHTFVPQEFRGKGVAAVLVREALEEARRQHWRLVPSCSYVAAYIDRHPEFADLVS